MNPFGYATRQLALARASRQNWKRFLEYTTKHPKESDLEEMLWSDPQDELKGVQPSPRGAGKIFGANITRRLLKTLDVNVLIRGHEPCQRGFKISHNGMILTISSTNKPPYSNYHAAYLQLNLSKKINNVKQLKRYIKQF